MSAVQKKNSQIFKCNQHTANLSQKIQTLYEEERFFDITLIAGIDSVRIQAHRFMLSTSSEYFSALLRSDMKESRANEVELKGIDGDTMKLIVVFMYKGCIELRSETVQAIFNAADYLGIPSLMIGCWDYMGKELTAENCIGIALLAKQHNMTELYNKTFNFACSHFEEVYKKKEFLQMSSEQVIDLLKSDDFSVPSEESIFHGVNAWVNHDKQNRASVLCCLLSVVRFWLLTPNFIAENVISACNTDDAQKLIFKWLQWHALPNTRSALTSADEIKPRKARGKITLLSGASTYELKLQTFDRESNSWSCRQLPLPWIKRTDFSASILDDKLVVAGGCQENKPLQSVESLDLDTLKWKSEGAMSNFISSPVILKAESTILILGGTHLVEHLLPLHHDNKSTHNISMGDFVKILIQRRENYEFSKFTATAEHYFAITKDQRMICSKISSRPEWIKRMHPEEYLREFGFVGVGEHLYVVGGISGGKITSCVRRYCLDMDTWTNVAPLQVPRSHVVCVALNNRLIACGGKTSTFGTECNVVEEYNPATNEWITLAPLLYSNKLYERYPLKI